MRSWMKNPFARKDANAADPHALPPPGDAAQPRRLEKLPFGAKCFFDPFDPQQYPTTTRPLFVAPPVPADEAAGSPSKVPGAAAADGAEQEQEGFEWDGEVDDSSPGSPSEASPRSQGGGDGSLPAKGEGFSPTVPPPLHRHHHHPSNVRETEEQLAARLARERQQVDEMVALLKLTLPDEAQARFRLEIELLRFLRARKHDVAQAVKQFESALQFRAEGKVDTLWDDAPVDPLGSLFQNICPHRNIGWDCEGHPVYYERTGLVRVNEMLKHMSEADVLRRHVRHVEHIAHRMQYLSWLHGRNITKCVIVQDLAGLSYNPEPAALRVFKSTSQLDQQYYPERLHKVFLINAPMSFRAIWATIKVFVDPNTRHKIEIFGANYRERLRQVIPAEQLPTMYGGRLELVWPNGDGCLPNVRPADAPDAPEDWQPVLLGEGEALPADADPMALRRSAEGPSS